MRLAQERAPSPGRKGNYCKNALLTKRDLALKDFDLQEDECFARRQGTAPNRGQGKVGGEGGRLAYN